MKKITLAICAALASASASADTILGFDATAGVWMPGYSGEIGADDLFSEGRFQNGENITFVQAALEHPIPLVPNILVAHSKIETRGNFTLSEDANFGDTTFEAWEAVGTDINLSYVDATLYYEILDNWVNLDLGLTARQFSGEMTADTFEKSETVELSGILPMVYGVARFDLPFTGWSIIAQGNGTSYKGDRHTDLTAKIRWDFVPALDFAIEAGYRAMTVDVQELDALQSDLEIKGPYLGLSLHL